MPSGRLPTAVQRLRGAPRAASAPPSSSRSLAERATLAVAAPLRQATVSYRHFRFRGMLSGSLSWRFLSANCGVDCTDLDNRILKLRQRHHVAPRAGCRQKRRTVMKVLSSPPCFDCSSVPVRSGRSATNKCTARVRRNMRTIIVRVVTHQMGVLVVLAIQ